ncbi:MAG: hypothetical protein R6V05_07860 [Candidatus Brocadiia bacterium]
MGDRAQRLLRRVALRWHLCAFSARFYAFLLGAAALYAVLLACSRLLAVIPDRFTPVTLAVLPGVALVLAVVFHRRVAARHVAHLTDQRAQTEDVFLTAVLIAGTAGRFQPLVLDTAEDQAAGVRARRVVPFRWARRAGKAVLVLAVLLAGVLYLPQFDPFGHAAERKRAEQREEALRKSRKATALRAEALRKQNPEAELSREVQKAVNELKRELDALKPAEQEHNLRRLKEQRANMERLWRKAGDKRLRDAFTRAGQAQRFGKAGGRKVEKWRRELGKGDTAALEKELASLKELARKLAAAEDAEARKKLEAELRERLEEMRKFMAEQAGSSSCSAALSRALEQLSLAELEGLSGDALRGMIESLDLASLELGALAQCSRDMQSLEQALEAIRMARMCNKLGCCTGGNCASLTAYIALYGKMIGKKGKTGGGGLGMLGPGMGAGGLAGEDPEQDTDFQPDQARSDITAGRMLMSMTTSGVSETGEAEMDYAEAVREVKRGASEAILREQIPPAYHDVVQTYFDYLEEPRAAQP